ncbi:hypothetical protein SteCoe_30286 [Stentor coeruleus]|uniref:Kinesin motor domain-containing protein n=1 Tax=Stentor coeruleus TaxID=5963 RepID=A0A1R2B3V8_9CILI|nr:hypothetical protein SteCoe_30286 [Stentor coeruleus]
MTDAARHLKVLCRVMPSHIEESCIIPCPEVRTIIASNRAINKQILNIRSQKNLNTLKSKLLEDSTLIKFDGIIDESLSQSKLFNTWLKTPTQDLLTGRSLCLLVFGITGSGKSYTIRGGEGKKRGFALRSVELLLAVLERYRGQIQLKVSVVAIFDENIIDLLQKQNPPYEVPINKSSDFHAALNQALKTRKSVGERGTKDNMHMIITIRLYQEYELLSEAYFVELAGSEFAREDKKVARGFNSISSQLTHSYTNWQTNPLCNFLKNGLDIYSNNPSNVFLICCASQNAESFQDTLASLKFTSRIKECLEKDSIKPDFIHMDNFIFYLSQSNLEDAIRLIESIESSLKKSSNEEKIDKYREAFSRHHQLTTEALTDIDRAKKLSSFQEDLTLSKAVSELTQLKMNYSHLQEQYSLLLEEKSQLSNSFSNLSGKVTDEILITLKKLTLKLVEEQEIREKLLQESKNLKNSVIGKTFEREQFECNCSEEIKSLQKALKEVSDDRQKTIEKLEYCLIENRKKEEYVQVLRSSSTSYEQENQHLNSIISDYENLIYELRKSLNSTSSKIANIEEEKVYILQENDRLRNHYKILKEKFEEQKLLTEREILSCKQENEDYCKKYENLLAKIEGLTLELSKYKLNNNHLTIQNKTLMNNWENVNFSEIDKKVNKVYEKLDEIQGLSNSLTRSGQ